MVSTNLCGRNRLQILAQSDFLVVVVAQCIVYIRADTGRKFPGYHGARSVASLDQHDTNNSLRAKMSTRQPFLPSRPAPRALNLGDDANAALPNPLSDPKDTAELGG